MKKYKLDILENEPVYIGVKSGYGGWNIYLSSVLDGKKIEAVLIVGEGTEYDRFEIPESSIGDSQIALLKIIYDKIMGL